MHGTEAKRSHSRRVEASDGVLYVGVLAGPSRAEQPTALLLVGDRDVGAHVGCTDRNAHRRPLPSVRRYQPCRKRIVLPSIQTSSGA